MPELTVELGVLIIGNLQDPIFDAERIAEVLAEGVSRDLRLPPIEVLAVEQWDPRFLAGDILTGCFERAERDSEQGSRNGQSEMSPSPQREYGG